MKKLTIAIFLMIFCFPVVSLAQSKNLTIGVTLHPYYSWVAKVAKEGDKVIPIIPEGNDPHSYQPRPDDIQKLSTLDILVVNGMGHDEYIKPMIKSADNKNLIVFDPHHGFPLIPAHTKVYAFEEKKETKVQYNSHTYISLTGAVLQINNIANELGRLSPDDAKLYKNNARKYTRSIRKLLGESLAKLGESDHSKARIATVHDGYAYLLRELGITETVVIQPRHGIEPSPRQLQDTIKRIKEAKVNVLFAELDYKKAYVDIIYKETGCKIYSLSHISNGPYTPGKFEQDMKKNLDTIIEAVANAK